MKRLVLSLCVCLVAGGSIFGQDYKYPFQNPDLSDDERIDNLISLMTVEEKIEQFGSAGIPRLGVASPGSIEAIHGTVMSGNPSYSAARNDLSTSFPQGYGLGETWDKASLLLVGQTMSEEARYYSNTGDRNRLVLWAPNADLARDPRWGRTEESLGEDPYLVGTLAAEMIKGIQGDDSKYWKTSSLMKHFLANSNEDDRYGSSSDFSKKLFYEYYSYGFYKGIQAGSRSLMLAYNAWNGVPCTCNPEIFDILHGWGMNGQLATDGGGYRYIVAAHHYYDDMVEAAAAIVKVGITKFLDPYHPYVDQAYEQGLITDEDLDKAIRGEIFVKLKLGLLDAPGVENPYSNIGKNGETEPWLTDEFKARSLDVARKSVVLLKNDNKTLPIDINSAKKIAVIGNRAESVIQDWYGAKPAYTVNALQGIKKIAEENGAEVQFAALDRSSKAEKIAEWADVAIVVVGNDPVTSPAYEMAPWGQSARLTEGREDVDRQSIDLDSEDLIKLIYRANPNTVVALVSSFPYAINWTVENVPAIVHMTQCSQDLGTALADVLFGNYNPAGRTTQTWVKDILDLPTMIDYDITKGRTYMYFQDEPLFPFGYGLSYTTFDYSNLSVEAGEEGGIVARVDVKNTGSVDGDEVVQLYIKFAGDDAAKRLKGFERVSIKAGETVTVEIPVSKLDISLWDENTEDWAVAAGKAEVQVGASSADIRVKKNVVLDENGFVKASACCSPAVWAIGAIVILALAALAIEKCSKKKKEA